MIKALSLSVALLLSGSALAMECPVVDEGSPLLASSDAQARLNFLRTEMLADRRHTRLWERGWLVGLSAAFVVQLGVVTAFPYKQRWSLYIGSAKPAIGIGAFLILPHHSVRDGRDFDLRIREGTEDVCALLLEGEHQLIRDAF